MSAATAAPNSTPDGQSAMSRLLADARLLQNYLAAAGLLNDTALDDAIAATERAIKAGEGSSTFSKLSVELSRAVNTAKPYISLLELRAGKSPFGPNAARRQSIRQIFVSVFSVLVICGVVLGFAITQDISRDISDLQRIETQNPLQKISELRKLVSEGALKDPKSAYYAQYQRLYSDTSLLFDSAREITTRTMPSTLDTSGGLLGKVFRVMQAEVLGPPRTELPFKQGEKPNGDATASNVPASVGVRSVSTAGVVPLKKSEKPASDAALGKGAASGGGPSDSIGVAAAYKHVPIIGPADCKPYDTGSVKVLYGEKNASFLAAALDRFDDYCFAQTLDINTGGYASSAVNNAIRALQDELFIMGVLFLPIVGGLLGSSIFVMHFLMNEKLAATMSWGYIIFRIIAGGAFGVIIGWFASSAAAGSSEVTQRISGTPFTLAFIAGFSIETLSNILLKYSKTGSVGSKSS